MELTGFACKEYKAFKSASVELKPITIFLGPNSAGKSTLNRILLLLDLSVRKGNVKKSVFSINKKNLKDSRSLFRNYDTNKQIEITINYSLNGDVEKLRREVIYVIKNKLKIVFGNQFSSLINIEDDEYYKDFAGMLRGLVMRFKPDILDQFEDCMTLLGYLEILNIDELSVTFYLRNRKGNVVVIDRVLVESKDVVVLDAKLERIGGQAIYNLKSDIDSFGLLEKYRKDIQEMIDEKLNLQYYDSAKSTFSFNSLFVDFLFLVISLSYVNFKKKIESKGINYIPPIREFSMSASDFKMGEVDSYSVAADNIIDIIINDDRVRNKVNDWFIGSLNCCLIVVEESGLKKLKVQYLGLVHSIGEMGSGISEVLPVLVRILVSVPGAINIIEHPELHLHPKMQADLIDFFLDNIYIDGKKKVFLIETHSEYMLYRLRRAVSEGRVSSNDIALYFISAGRQKGGSKVRKIKIQKKGSFKWPENFSTVFEDTASFVTNQLD